MLKITIDGNPVHGWDARVLLPARDNELAQDTNLFVSCFSTDTNNPERVNNLGDVLPRLREDILTSVGMDIFTEEFVLIHEDSSELFRRMISVSEEVDLQDITDATVVTPTESDVEEPLSHGLTQSEAVAIIQVNTVDEALNLVNSGGLDKWLGSGPLPEVKP